jgi:hypothetical protein
MLAMTLVDRESPRRDEVEAFIKRVYSDDYGANAPELPPRLIAHFGDDGEVACAAGLRTDASGFFSERYLTSSVEAVVGGAVSEEVRREHLIEVTSLASRAPKKTARFIGEIGIRARDLGHTWSLFTVTRRLAILLRRYGAPLIYLADADPGRVEDPARWGDYYALDPKVFVSPLTRTPCRSTTISRAA